MNHRVSVVVVCLFVLVGGALAANQPLTFNKVKLLSAFQGVGEGATGSLIIDRHTIRFETHHLDGFAIPNIATKDLFYSRVSGRRIKAAVLPAVVFPPTLALLASKGRKHYMTVSFDDGGEMVGAVEFKLHKSNYRGVLRTAAQVTSLPVQYDQEGIRDPKQTFVSTSDARANETRGVLEIASNPDGAEVEIDGAYVGVSPQTRALPEGRYNVKVRLDGHRCWERKVHIASRETTRVEADLKARD